MSSQRDSETALLSQEREELAEAPTTELNELTALYQAKGLSEPTARQVATDLTAHDTLAAHLDAGLHIDPDDPDDPANPANPANPIQTGAASAASLTLGALLPLVAILLPPAAWRRVPETIVVVLIALGIAGAVSARIGGSNARRAVIRVVTGGAIGLAFTAVSSRTSAARRSHTSSRSAVRRIGLWSSPSQRANRLLQAPDGRLVGVYILVTSGGQLGWSRRRRCPQQPRHHRVPEGPGGRGRRDLRQPFPGQAPICGMTCGTALPEP